jgi:hypothetical protein
METERIEVTVNSVECYPKQCDLTLMAMESYAYCRAYNFGGEISIKSKDVKAV